MSIDIPDVKGRDIHVIGGQNDAFCRASPNWRWSYQRDRWEFVSDEVLELEAYLNQGVRPLTRIRRLKFWRLLGRRRAIRQDDGRPRNYPVNGSGRP